MIDDSFISLSYEYIESDDSFDNKKAYFASARFFVSLELLKSKEYKKLLIVDTDSLFIKDVQGIYDEYDDYDVTLVKRFYHEYDHLKFAAGLILAKSTPTSIHFLESVSKYISGKISINEAKWYIDQVAMYHAYKKLNLYSHRFGAFKKDHCDWSFSETGFIWTGKGERKHNNESYTQRRRHFCDIGLVSILVGKNFDLYSAQQLIQAKNWEDKTNVIILRSENHPVLDRETLQTLSRHRIQVNFFDINGAIGIVKQSDKLINCTVPSQSEDDFNSHILGEATNIPICNTPLG